MNQVQTDYQHVSTRQDEMTNALVGHAQAKYDLETQKANKVVAGVEGKNQTERDAHLRVQLKEFFDNEIFWNLEVLRAKGKFANAKKRFEISVMEFNKTPRDTF